MAEPKVTILIANHNYGKYLGGCLRSAISQHYNPTSLEVCVVDDASTDDSWSIIHNELFRKIRHDKVLRNKFEMKVGTLDNGLKVRAIRLNECRGPSSARNFGIQETLETTDAYLILDADDEAYQNKTATLVNRMAQAPQLIGVVYGDYDIINVVTGVVVREFKEPFNKNRLWQECIVHSGALINKEALTHVMENTGYYDSTMRTVEDWDLWLRISDRFMIVHVAESLSLVRVHPQNSTFSVATATWQQNWLRVRNKAMERMNVQTT